MFSNTLFIAEMLPAFDERGEFRPWSKKGGVSKIKRGILDGNISRDYQTLVHITTDLVVETDAAVWITGVVETDAEVWITGVVETDAEDWITGFVETEESPY